MTSMATFVRQGIQDVNDLKGALQLAMQLEFATLPPYLCAEWSVDANNDPDQVGNMIGGIALQEMFHFALAGNMLAAIGGSPSVATADFIPKFANLHRLQPILTACEMQRTDFFIGRLPNFRRKRRLLSSRLRCTLSLGFSLERFSML
jgi:hypothetical protein